MPKSKAAVEHSGSDSASEGPSKKRQLDESDEQVTKKAKTETEHVAHGSEGESKERQGQVLVTKSGEKYIDLGKKKRAAVREFKGNVFLDIREYYGADDEEKPGKKGISLTLDQWKALRESASEIDQLFSTQKKK